MRENFFDQHKILLLDLGLLFFIMVVFFYRWIFLEPYGLFASDVRQDYISHRLVALSFSEGRFPIWDPYFFGDIIAYFNSGIFYPANLLMDFIQSLNITDLNFGYSIMKINAFLHFFMASAFMYLLVRYFQISRLPSILAGVVFAYSGYLVKEYVHLSYLQGGVWLPLVLLFYYRAVHEKRSYAVIAAILFAISLLAGQTQPGVYYLVVVLIFSIYSLFETHNERKKEYGKIFFSFLTFIVVAFGLFAVQFFPTEDYSKWSLRTGMTYEETVDYSSSPLYLLTHPLTRDMWGGMESTFWNSGDDTTLPADTKTKWLYNFFGALPNEMTFYLGLLPFFLFPFALFSPNKRLRYFLLTLLLISVLLMLSRSVNLIGQFYYYFLGNTARVPVRASYLWSFSLAFLAALGLEVILTMKEQKEKLFRQITNFNFLVFGMLFFIALPLIIFVTLSNTGSPKITYFFFPLADTFALFVVYFFIYSLILAFLVRTNNYWVPVVLFGFFVVELFSFHASNSFLINRDGRVSDVFGAEDNLLIRYFKEDKSYPRVQGLGLAAPAHQLFNLGYGTTGSFGFAHRPSMELYSAILDDASSVYDLMGVKYFYTPSGKINDLISSVKASSFLADYPPGLAFDSDTKTQWRGDWAASGNIWIGATFKQPETLTKISLLPSYIQSNATLEGVEIAFSDGSSQKKNFSVEGEWLTADVGAVKTQWIKVFVPKTYQNVISGFKEVELINVAGNQALVGSSKFQKIANELYLNTNAFPRVYVTHSSKVFNDKTEMLQAILADRTGEEMRRNVFLFNNPTINNFGQVPEGKSEAYITGYRGGEVKIMVKMAANGFVVLTDTWMPGWKAYIDGVETQVLPAYNALRAVPVLSGSHTLIFRYDPAPFRLGLMITGLTILSILFYFIIPKVTNLRKR